MTQQLPRLPDLIGRRIVNRQTVNSVSNASRTFNLQATLSADNAPLRIIYGEDLLGAVIANVLFHNNRWLIQVVWGEGEIEGVQQTYFDNEVMPGSIQANHYNHSYLTAPDPWLVAAFAAQGITYADVPPGVAYSVYRIPAADFQKFPTITALVRGLKVYDPRTNSTVFTKNPSLVLADFINNSVYGRGQEVDWASVAVAADLNDELLDGKPRREIGFTLASLQDTDSVLDTLRMYASVWLVHGPNGIVFIPDRPSNTVATLHHASGDIAMLHSLEKRPHYDAPTVVRVRYTDTSAIPWKEDKADAVSPFYTSADTYRIQELSFPGIHSAAAARRESIELLNKQTLFDLHCELEVFDNGIAFDVGDVVEVTHPIGLANKKFRLVAVSPTEDNNYLLSLLEYDAAAYSDSIVVDPSSPDTNIPSPTEPLPVTGLALNEEVFQLQNGTYSSRIRATWVLPEFPFVAQYRIDVTAGATLVFTGTAKAGAATWASPAVQEGQTYQVDITTVSSIGAVSESVAASLLALGKQLPPGNVPALNGFEIGGEVRLIWDTAIDIDIWRYEVRYTTAAGTWESGALIDRTDALRLVTNEIPAGTWKFMVKAVDSVGNYSPDAATRVIEVSLDSSAFLVDNVDYDTPILTNMAAYSLGRVDQVQRYATEDNETTASKFASSLSTYSEPMSAYNDVASEFLTEIYDFGVGVSGNWTATLSTTALVGTHVKQLGVSSDGTEFTFGPLTSKTSGRFSRVKASSSAGSAFAVTMPEATTRVDAVPREEAGTTTTLSVGGALVQLNYTYISALSLQLTPNSVTPRQATFDRLLVAPATGLALHSVFSSGTDPYSFITISDAGSRVIQSGDFLEYDVFVVSSAAVTGGGGAEVEFTNGAMMRIAPPAVDLNGTGPIDRSNENLPAGVWFTRKFDMSAFVGLTVARVMVAHRPFVEAPGSFLSVYRDIRITNGSGTVRLTIWSEGEPTLNIVHYQRNLTQVQCGPSNSFLAYMFDQTGNQVSGTVSYLFKGV